MNHEETPLSTADIARTEHELPSAAKESARVAVESKGERPPARSSSAVREPERSSTERPAALFPEGDIADLRRRWTDAQGGFVDEPRRAVEQADALVADVMKRLAETFAKETDALEGQWERGDNVTTEDLRVVLQRYRSFFDRLLSV